MFGLPAYSPLSLARQNTFDWYSTYHGKLGKPPPWQTYGKWCRMPCALRADWHIRFLLRPYWTSFRLRWLRWYSYSFSFGTTKIRIIFHISKHFPIYFFHIFLPRTIAYLTFFVILDNIGHCTSSEDQSFEAIFPVHTQSSVRARTAGYGFYIV